VDSENKSKGTTAMMNKENDADIGQIEENQDEERGYAESPMEVTDKEDGIPDWEEGAAASVHAPVEMASSTKIVSQLRWATPVDGTSQKAIETKQEILALTSKKLSNRKLQISPRIIERKYGRIKKGSQALMNPS
jgi:hypothetical protein